jgi:hypothetical protein
VTTLVQRDEREKVVSGKMFVILKSWIAGDSKIAGGVGSKFTAKGRLLPLGAAIPKFKEAAPAPKNLRISRNRRHAYNFPHVITKLDRGCMTVCVCVCVWLFSELPAKKPARFERCIKLAWQKKGQHSARINFQAKDASNWHARKMGSIQPF